MPTLASPREGPVRAAIVLIQDGHLCLIRRQRTGHTYYLFPGGGTEAGETPRQAAQREALEELGLHVHVHRLLARMPFDGNEQRYYHATITGGTFGTGTGAELTSSPHAPAGSYTPTWLHINDMPRHDVRPRHLADLLSHHERWPHPDVIDLTY